MGAIDKIPYGNQPLDSSGDGQSRMISADARRGVGQMMAYSGPDGTPLAVTGDEQAMFVRILEEVPGIVAVSDIPQDAIGGNGSGVLRCALCPASLHEAWVTDSRDTSGGTPSARWLLLFDRTTAPSAGDIPSYAPIRLCAGSTTSIDELHAPLGFTTGIVLAISTTANQYTAIVAAADYAITARVLGT